MVGDKSINQLAQPGGLELQKSLVAARFTQQGHSAHDLLCLTRSGIEEQNVKLKGFGGSRPSPGERRVGKLLFFPFCQ